MPPIRVLRRVFETVAAMVVAEGDVRSAALPTPRSGIACLVMATVLVACATVPEQPPRGARYRFATIELTSRVTHAPLSAESLADPVVRDVIFQELSPSR